MPSTYTSSNRFEKPGLLEQDGTWGTTLNTDYDLIDAAISGYTSIAMADANYSLTVASGSADQARIAFVNFTGTLTATRTITVPAVSKIRVIANNTTQSLIFSTGGGTTLTISAGLMSVTCCDGTNVLQVSSNTTNAATLNGQAASYYLNASNLATGTVPIARLPAGDTVNLGVVQLINSVASSSTTLAPVAANVKTAYDQAVTATNNAATAQSAANSAQSTANGAQTTANTGVANASTAQATANAAVSTANTAASNAASAQSTANTVAANYLPNPQGSDSNQRGYMVYYAQSSAITLPAGGTWFYVLTFYSGGGGFSSAGGGFVGGGTLIFAGGAAAVGFAMRTA